MFQSDEVSLINEELTHLHQKFISFSQDHYQEKIDKLVESYLSPELKKHSDLADIFRMGVTIWILINVSSFENHRTLLNLFLEQQDAPLHPQTYKRMENWISRQPSVYKILSTNKETHYVTIEDLRDHKTYSIRYYEGNEFIEGSVLIGTLVPFIEAQNFLYSMIKLYPQDEESVPQLLQEYTEKDGGLAEHFPAFLNDALLLGHDGGETNPQYEEVVQIFADHMVDKEMSDEVILKGISLWNQYSQKEHPSLKKPESYAAALEYYVQKVVLKNETVTQSQIAEEYGVPHGSVSNNYRKLSNVLA
ncbi:helix-turn-helix domain-containing protein [Salinibacillus aidingensis]|uniref:Helix-turn-helix domain-containing protein n=1 Tax=Salinibacillus aidingensis TaxID=237684 RepID=A0ABP3KTM5_9BACI